MQVRRPVLLLALVFVALAQLPGPSGRHSASPQVLWTFDSGGCLTHAPAVDGDMVYVSSGNGVLGQLERATGKLRRVTVMGRNTSACMFRGPLMLVGNVAISGSSSVARHTASLRAIELRTGRQQWTRSAGRGLAPSLTRLGRRVFVPTLDGELWCLNIESGERLWSVPLTLGAWGSLAVGVDRVFAGGMDGVLYAIDADSGRVEWRTPLGASITTAVRRGERALFVGTRDGRVHRVDLRNGAVLASRRLDARLAPQSAPLVQPDALVFQLGNHDDSEQALVSVDRSLSRERWRITTNEHWTTARAFAWKNTVAVGTALGDVRAFCSTDGSPAWTHKLPGTIRTIAGADETLYIGTTAGQVQALKPPVSCAGN